jgi:cobalt-zinc-cadmium resistance protein CzcA
MEWVGELGDLQNALARLGVAIPLSLALIVLLLFVSFSSLTETLLAASVLPMAMIGGILALRLTGTPLSVSAAIGFVGLFGISVMNAILVIAAFNRAIEARLSRTDAVLQACQGQLRPVLMTSMAACVGLLPAALSTGIGSQVQRPLALVVVGGVLLAPVFILTVLPVLVDLFCKTSEAPMTEGEPALAPAE